ncbi:MAG: helix-turn-helix transcriptional regulator [Halomonas sp.]|uniref:helix-turn-helix transcriptional regulator n=1 Tax=Halomonas sp. TaxID=1486246 RepID=UPI003F93E943
MSKDTIRQWINAKDLARRCDVGINTIWRWARDPNNAFPEPVKLGANCTRWRLADVMKWEDEREAA